jgi:hypothetical protein
MANLHVLSTGSNTAPYDTWAKAATALSTATTAAAAGDTIFVSNAHTETAAGQTITFTNGTQAQPIYVISGVPDTTSNITSRTVGGEVKSSNTTFLINGGAAYIYGMKFECTSATSTQFSFAGSASSNHMYDACVFTHSSTGSSGRIVFGPTSTSSAFPQVTLKGCSFKFSHASQSIIVNAHMRMIGGSFISGTNPTAVFSLGENGRGGILNATGVDFSANIGTSFNIFNSATSASTQLGRVRNCKMPSSWTGRAIAVNKPDNGGSRFELLNYGDTDTNYRFITADSMGVCKESVAVYRTSGAQDEATQYSIEMASTANVSHPHCALRSPPIMIRQEAVPGGATRTVKVEIVHDGASALTSAQCWLEVEFLGTSGYPIATLAHDTVEALQSGAAQASSSEAWTGDSGTGPNGSTTWNTLKLEVPSLVFEETGYVIATVCLAAASTTIYVDPKITIS